MDSQYQDLQCIGEEASLWLDKDSGAPEERFFELQLLFERLIEIKATTSLPADWSEYLEGVEGAIHEAIQSLREQISPQTATQLNIKVQAERARHRYSEAEMARKLRYSEKNRHKLLLLTSLLIFLVFLVAVGIGWYQWKLFMSNEGWFYDIRAERWERVDRRLSFGKSIETYDSAGRTALIISAARGKLSAVHKLVERGADLQAVDHQGMGVLHYAAASDNPDLVNWLLEAGLDANARSQSGTTPLHQVFREGPGSRESLEIMTILIGAGADEKAVDDEESVLMSAVLWVRGAYYERPLEALKVLIEGGADVNYRNSKGATPLSHALVKYLPDEPNPKRISEMDPLIRLLLENGAKRSGEEIGIGRGVEDPDRLEFLPSVR